MFFIGSENMSVSEHSQGQIWILQTSYIRTTQIITQRLKKFEDQQPVSRSLILKPLLKSRGGRIRTCQ